jgi:2-polyprenyl-3-methyl-5-hydroxy-6-metoxy-1,4-benzoquinol methylase
MALNARTSIIRSLLPEHSERLLDVGCGPITPDYPYADKAPRVTCVDWNLKVSGSVPPNIECLDGDFTSMDLAPDAYDSVIAADVFEHVLLEQEPLFVDKCVSALRPGGNMIISVPHQGTFAYLDPYQVKPTIHRILAGLGLYKSVHNGCCDIRKGHKHYSLPELIDKFRPLQLSKVIYFGYVFDPLLSWAVALTRRGSGQILHSGMMNEELGFSWLQRACRRELDHDYGQRSFNVAVSFYKPATVEGGGLGTGVVQAR